MCLNVFQTFCANCGGSDRVTYEWRVDSNSNDTQMDDVDIRTFTQMSPSDGSIVIDVDGFLPVVTNESLAMVFRGTCDK